MSRSRKHPTAPNRSCKNEGSAICVCRASHCNCLMVAEARRDTTNTCTNARDERIGANPCAKQSATMAETLP